MMAINFNAYKYYPSLRSRQAEMKGYKELTPEIKDKLLPIVVLGPWGNVKTPSMVLHKVSEHFGNRRFFLDLAPGKPPQDWEALQVPDGDFKTWREFAAIKEQAIPVAFIRADQPMRSTVRQALALERKHGSFAVRARSPQVDSPILQAIASTLDDVKNSLFILDFGYVREMVDETIFACAEVINKLREIAPSATVVVTGTSFPASFSRFQERSYLVIDEREIFERLGGEEVSIYGDHSSIHTEVMEELPAYRPIPRVDYPTIDTWFFKRYRNEDGDREGAAGYVRCAKEIINLTDWDASLVNEAWGAKKIYDAAHGNIESMGAAAPWISVRVNLHLHRQTMPPRTTLDANDQDYPF
jgi:hypothetical protein